MLPAGRLDGVSAVEARTVQPPRNDEGPLTMPSFKYFRPKTIEEALTLLEQGVPLAGGTTLTPNRYRLDTVVDLQDLPLGALESKADMLEGGAGCTLQQIVE